MGTRAEVLPWERQPREGEAAFAAFLAYRDLGPYRTHEATRKRLGKTPGYLKPIERWSALRHWRPRAGAWDAHLQAERDRAAAEEAAKWERRRLQALEDGWQTCRALRARLAQMLALPPETPAVAAAEPAEEELRALPGAVATASAGPGGEPPVPPIATPEEVEKTVGSASVRWNYLTVARLSRLIVEQEWALLREALPPPVEIDPWTATDEEIKSYLARHPRLGRPPPR